MCPCVMCIGAHHDLVAHFLTNMVRDSEEVCDILWIRQVVRYLILTPHSIVTSVFKLVAHIGCITRDNIDGCMTIQVMVYVLCIFTQIR